MISRSAFTSDIAAWLAIGFIVHIPHVTVHVSSRFARAFCNAQIGAIQIDVDHLAPCAIF
jgi:hypothetical protein